MAFVKQFGEFKLFQPTEEEAEGGAIVFRTVEFNNAFIAKNNEPPADALPITGTFVAAHAPDYVGTPTLHWDVARWRDEFRRLKAKGMDTAVLQAAAWKELEECYYPSRALADFTAFDVVAPLVEAAAECGVTLHLGALGTVTGWSMLSGDALAGEIELHKAVLRELAERFGDAIAGFYFPCETAYRGVRDVAHEEQYAEILKVFCETARQLLPGGKIVMSPSSKYFAGKEEEFLGCWKSIFSKATPDILVPQDSIGCGGCDLQTQPAMWRLWDRLAKSLKMALWANIELFERRSFGGEAPFVTASPQRVAWQRANVTPCVSKCICWEALCF